MFCCHTDHRGAPTRLTDEKGRLAWSASYSAFGAAHPRGERLRQPLRLPGQYHDEETGLHQNRWRSYDPKLGRYLSPDPLGLAGGLNLYAYAGNDPVNQSDPLGLFPSVSDVASRVLGAKTGGHASQAYSQVQNLLHPHLSAATPPFMAAGPSPLSLGGFPGMKPLGAGVPTFPLPGLPGLAPAPIPGLNGTSFFGQGISGPLPTGHLHAQHAKHNQRTTLHSPPPAQAAKTCAPKPQTAPAAPAAPHAAVPHKTFMGFVHNVPGSAKQLGLGVLHLPQTLWQFGGGIGDSLGDSVVAPFTDDPDYKKALLDDAAQKDEQSRTMLKGVLGGDHGLVATLGQAAADKLYAQEYPAAAEELNKDAASQWSKAKSGVGNEAYSDPVGFTATVLPLAGMGRLAALGKVSRAAEAADAAASAASKAGDVEKAAALGRQADAYRQTARALEGGKAGDVLRRAKGAAAQKLSAKAKAAAKTMQERRAGRGDDPYAPHTKQSLAKGQAAAAGLRGKWHDGTHGRPPEKGQPALATASGGGKGPTSLALGKPGENSNVSKMADGKAGRSKPATRGGRGRGGGTKVWETPPSPIKARTRAVAYGKTDLSEKALAYRKNHNYWKGKNLAVFEYKDANGIHRMVTAISDTGVHSERSAWKALQAKGIQADQITRIYSEREPCMLPGAFCGKFIDETFPQADVSYSFEYGDKASRTRSNTAMKQVLKALKDETK